MAPSYMASHAVLKDLHGDLKRRMDKAVVDFQTHLVSLRTGRANAQMLDQVRVDYYGTPTPLTQVAPVVDAGSAQSRADVALIGMSAVLALTGLQWLALAPKEAEVVLPGGQQLDWTAPGLPPPAADELRWCATCTRTAHSLLCIRLPTTSTHLLSVQ